MTSIRIDGLSELIARVSEAQARKILEPPMRRAVLRLERGMKQYPPQRPGSTYRRGIDPRSERLGQRWTSNVQATGSGLRGTVGNNASYAPWVQASAFQARTHRNRWQTDVDVMDDNEAKIVDDFARTVEKALEG